ncbi:MAG TPA: hypothetical protein VEI06_03170 [Gemmatimonadaceae bacterium]|nr:hypothetical protein [Gemmatimonadaceae bacterium]
MLGTHRSVIAITLIAALAAGCASAPPPDRVYVRVAPPPERVEVITAAPGPFYAWQKGYWRWNGHDYAWVAGRWALVEEHRTKWEAGHWQSDHHGWYWVEGHWS